MKRILIGTVALMMVMPAFAGDPSGPLLPMGEYFCTVTYECGDGTGASHSYTNSDENNVVITVSENTTCSKPGTTFSHWAVTCPGFATPLSPVAYPGESYDTTGCSDDSGNNFVFTAVYTSDNARTTSKPYVDDQIATRQVKIPAANTAGVGAGDSVITYTNVAGGGVIGERALFTGGEYNASTDADKMITASALNSAFTNLPTTDTTTLQCANQDCTLWTIVDQTAYGETITLPAGYTRLEYIQSTGTQYIDTGVKGNLSTKVVLDLQIPAYNDNGYILGTRTAQNTNAFVIGSNSGKFVSATYPFAQFDSVSPTVVQQAPNFDLNRHVYELSSNGFYIDGVLRTSYSNPTSFTTQENLTLFGRYHSGTFAYGVFRAYGLKLYENNVLVRNFIPAKNSSNVVGMYDIVNDSFYQKQGSGDFIAGPVVN